MEATALEESLSQNAATQRTSQFDVVTSSDLLGTYSINGKGAYGDPFTYFPTTIFVVLLIHVVFIFQWFRRIPRKKIMVTYQSLVQGKRFHKLWLALLSHPPIQEEGFGQTDRENPAREQVDRTFSPAVAMGGPDGESWVDGNSVLGQLFRTGVERGQRQWKLFTKGTLSGFPLLLYNSHVLWSCRALEQVYNEDGNRWRYARCLVGLVTLSIAAELCLSHALVQATLRRQHQQPSAHTFGEIQPTLDASFDHSFLERLRQRIERRAIGTMTTLAAAVLVLFRFQYINVPLPVLPFLTDRLFSRFPTLTYLACMGILAILARSNHPIGVVTGALVGLMWAGFSLHFLADAYHGNWLVLFIFFLTLLSCKGQYSNMLPCIEYVSWYDADIVAATVDEPVERPLSWCLQPAVFDESETPSNDEEDDASVDRGEEALLEFTRVRSESSDGQDAPVDPDMLEQGRRPRRTRIRSQRP